MKSTETCNHKDHENWNRRSFIQALGLTGIGSLALANSNIAFAKETKLTNAINTAESDNILIIVRLFGGNDGLNTIIPLNQYDEYANARPNLKISEDNLWNLSDEYAMPNHMGSLESMWKDGKMKVIHSVGYEDQSQSHFKGQDIWSAAKEDNSYESGWMGRYFEENHPDYQDNPPNIPTAIQIGAAKNITFNTEVGKYSFSVENVNNLKAIANTGLNYSLENMPDCTYGDKLTFMRSVTNSTYKYADIIYDAYNSSNDYTGGVGYANDDFASSLSIISRLIKGNLGTKVYMLTLGGFDTHSTQADEHQALLTTLSDTMEYLYEDLNDAGWGDKVMTMCISEFGRRVEENGSRGTDHGTAGPVMFFGNGLDGNGFVGEHASLKKDELINNNRDLKPHTDYKQIYATVLKEWMCVNESIVNNVILDQDYDTLDLGFKCSGSLSIDEFTDPESALSFATSVYYQDSNTTVIKLNSNVSQHIIISLYDMNGSKISELTNQFISKGQHHINVSEATNYRLSRGYYIYTAVTNSKTINKKIMLL